jgi:uncharacterized protein
MALNNSERIGRSLEALRVGLSPFFIREVRTKFKDEEWMAESWHALENKPQYKEALILLEADVDEFANKVEVNALLQLVRRYDRDVFFEKLGHVGKTYLSEIQSARNKWAHQETFSIIDAHRVVDTITRLLEMISSEQAKVTEEHARILLRTRYDEEAKQSQRRAKAQQTTLFSVPEGLKPWREVILPHTDVSEGSYQQAEFAADLSKVVDGSADEEYKNPKEFFKRTYITKGMLELLVAANKRMNSKGGDPVIQLKTAFGGGKTHSMLALYHMFSGDISLADIPSGNDIKSASGIDSINKVNRAVIVGTAMSPARSHKREGASINTLWGEIAYQLGGVNGYNMVADEDKNSTAATSDILTPLLEKYAPCIIVIDELVAYARNVYGHDQLPAGSFDSIMTFVQALTESIKVVPNAQLVLSIPESEMEIGGNAGRKVLNSLEHTVGRIESVWAPVGAGEGFEIVRRRLFSRDIDFAARDAVITKFMKMYQDDSAQFPNKVQTSEYKDKMTSCYPIHPELFDRLYEDWSTLERFQKTRGVLRLMAAVIHELWIQGDNNLLIMPGTFPLISPNVRNEILKYLPEQWPAVVDLDIDGENSNTKAIDKQFTNLGKYQASRKVGRSIFLGSAPSVHQATARGTEEVNIRLASIQPGDNFAAFSDALRRMSSQLTYLYNEDTRYWYDTRPSINRTASERAVGFEIHKIISEVEIRVRSFSTHRLFKGVHRLPATSADVPDDQNTRIVVMSPKFLHRRNVDGSKALEFSSEILDSRGTAPRYYKNALLFIAPDKLQWESLEEGVRDYLAWDSILNDTDVLNLDAGSVRQATKKKNVANKTVSDRINETFIWAIYPNQEDGTSQLEMKSEKIRSGDGHFIQRAVYQLSKDTTVYTQWSPDGLLHELEKWNLFKEDSHISLKQLWEYFSSFPYLPRLESDQILIQAITQGLMSKDYFGYAGSVSDSGDYRGLVFGDPMPQVQLNDSSVLIKKEKAEELEKEYLKPVVHSVVNGSVSVSKDDVRTTHDNAKVENAIKLKKRFYASTELDPLRFTSLAGQIGENIIAHLQAHKDAKVKITVDIQADSVSGFNDNLVRTVSENSNALNINQHGFENE